MKARAHERPRGFTLVEVMVATLVFSIGLMAVITMEYAAITAYGSSRDQTVAMDLGYRVLSIARVEAANWSASEQGSAVGGASAPLQAIYDASDATNPSPMGGSAGQQALLTRLTANPGQWQVVTPAPVDGRMRPRPGARYCVYARGAFSELSRDNTSVNVGVGTPVDARSMMTLHLAVIYPGQGKSYATAGGCETLPMCSGAQSSAVDELRPQGISGGLDLTPLEECGWREIYINRVVRR